jgi:hypothetical protein
MRLPNPADDEHSDENAGEDPYFPPKIAMPKDGKSQQVVRVQEAPVMQIADSI